MVQHDTNAWENEAPWETIVRFGEKHIYMVDHKGQKQPLRFLDYQLEFIKAGFPAEGIKNKLILCGPKKIGKTAVTLPVTECLFIHPRFAKPNQSIYLVANSKEQAGILFSDLATQLEGHPVFSKMVQIVRSSKTILLTDKNHKGYGSTIKVLAADAKTAQGIRVSVAVYDELGECRPQDRALFDVLQLGTANNPDAKFIAISTIAAEPDHFFTEEINAAYNDPMAVVHMYQAPMGCAFDHDPTTWHPGVGKVISLEWFQNKVQSLIKTANGQRQCRRYLFNQPVSLVGSIVSPDQLDMICPTPRPATYDDAEGWEPGEKLWLGLDIGSVADLSALVGVSQDGLVKGWGYKADALIDNHEAIDQMPYRGWQRAGWMVGTSGNTVNPQAIADKIVELWNDYDVQGLFVDRAKIDEVRRLLNDKIGVYIEGEPPTGLRLVEHQQGFISMGEAVSALEVAILDHEIRLDGNPLLYNHIIMADVKTDDAGNRKFVKGGRHSATNRIDLAVSAAMCVNYWRKEREAPIQAYSSPFSTNENGEVEFIW